MYSTKRRFGGRYSLHVVGGMLGGVGVEVLRGDGANLPLLHDLVQEY